MRTATKVAVALLLLFALLADALLIPIASVSADTAPLNQWPATPQMTGTTGNPANYDFTISDGTNRLLVILISCYASGGQTGQTFTATYGGKTLTQAVRQNTTSVQTWIGYLKETDIASRSGNTVTVTVTGTHSNVVAYIASYSGVDQGTPVTASGSAYISNTNNRPIGGPLNVNAGGYGIYGWSGRSGRTRTSDTESYTEHSDVNTGTFTYGVASKSFSTTTTTNPSVTWSGNNRVSVSFITLNPAVTTIGDGTSPSNKTVGPSYTNQAVSAFTLVTSSAGTTDTVTGMVVTITGTGPANVAGVKIYQDNGTTPNEYDASDTLKGTASYASPTATFTGLSIAVNSTSTQYIITLDTIASPANGETMLAAVTGITASNNIVNNDTTDATLTIDSLSPTVTIDQKAGQADPTSSSPIYFTVVFSETVTDFATGDVTLSGTAGATTADVTGSGTNYEVAVSGMTSDGTVIATIEAGKAHDAFGNPSDASSSTDNTVTYDTNGPTVTIDQKVGQADPTSDSPVYFTVVFSETVTDFATGDVTLSGTAGATTADVTGSGTNYEVAVSGMTVDGTIIATIEAGKANDAAGNPSAASTSTDNTVTYISQSIEITAPSDISGWTLSPGEDNTTNGTLVVNVEPNGKSWHVRAYDDNSSTLGHMTTGTVNLSNAMRVQVQGQSEVELSATGGNIIPTWTGDFSNTITFKQLVTWDDEPGTYQIVVQFIATID